jgi:hypothetical protein
MTLPQACNRGRQSLYFLPVSEQPRASIGGNSYHRRAHAVSSLGDAHFVVWRSISDYRVLTAADNTTVPTLADKAFIQNFVKYSHLVPNWTGQRSGIVELDCHSSIRFHAVVLY